MDGIYRSHSAPRYRGGYEAGNRRRETALAGGGAKLFSMSLSSRGPATYDQPDMKTIYCLGIFLVLGAATILRPQAAEKEESLFNGRDLTGWTRMHDVEFEVVDGNLRLVKGMGWLRTEEQYSDFVLEFEWRALQEKYDSGIFFRAGLEGKPWPDRSYQINLRYDMLGGLVQGFKPLVPAETPRMPLHQWVKFRIEAKGNRVTLDVDGERAWETDRVEPGRGYIGIQVEDRSFDFRNFRIVDLSAE